MIITTRSPAEVEGVQQVISGIDVTDDNLGEVLSSALKGTKIDILINNAVFLFTVIVCLFFLFRSSSSLKNYHYNSLFLAIVILFTLILLYFPLELYCIFFFGITCCYFLLHRCH